MNNYSWIKIYKELAEKLVESNESRYDLIKDCKDCQIGYLEDKNNNNELMPLDLFTLFGTFNRSVNFKNRTVMISHLQEKLGLKVTLPSDFNGIPTMDNRNSWFQNMGKDKTKLDGLFKMALEETPAGEFGQQFNECLEIKGVGLSKLTTGLFWINPEKFMPIAGPVISYLKRQFVNFSYENQTGIKAWNEVFKNMNWEKYKRVLDFLLDTSNTQKKFWELSYESIEKSVENEILESKNVIFHGAPGTGKTYSVLKAVESLTGGDISRYTLVQFHPSYGYEDFIDGIKPVKNSSSNSINLQLENGTFKKLCKSAFDNLKSDDETKSYFFIADEINRAELSRVFGELLLCLEEDKRLHFQDKKLEGTKIKTQNSNLWEDEHAVVIENNDKFFGIPENLYFIGTMNDIDRSVDSFDMALRRRFTWIRTEFKDNAIRQKYPNHTNLEKYIEVCNNLNEHITSTKDNGLNLGFDYQLGQSYFLKPNDLTQDDLDITWDKYIAPLLTEYLRSSVEQHEIPKKLETAQKLFKLN